MTGRKATQAPSTTLGALPPAVPEPSELAVAVSVAQDMLTAYAGVDHGDLFALNQAHGAIREALRILLRAVGADPEAEKGSALVRTPGGDQRRPAAVAALHRLARADYDSNADRRAQDHRDDAHLTTYQAAPATVDTGARCPAAHPEDPTPCGGPVVVTVLDKQNAGADGCEHHGARLLASLDGGRVYPLPDAPEGAAIRVFKAADGIRPFPWYENAPRTRPETLSRAENRERGEGR